MDDGVVSMSKVVASLLWVWTASMLASAWITAIWGSWLIAGLLAATACASSAVAATMQIRVYTIGVCAQLRALRVEVQGCRPEAPTMRGL